MAVVVYCCNTHWPRLGPVESATRAGSTPAASEHQAPAHRLPERLNRQGRSRGNFTTVAADHHHATSHRFGQHPAKLLFPMGQSPAGQHQHVKLLIKSRHRLTIKLTDQVNYRQSARWRLRCVMPPRHCLGQQAIGATLLASRHKPVRADPPFFR